MIFRENIYFLQFFFLKNDFQMTMQVDLNLKLRALTTIFLINSKFISFANDFSHEAIEFEKKTSKFDGNENKFN
jgi:hypothetical protein